MLNLNLDLRVRQTRAGFRAYTVRLRRQLIAHKLRAQRNQEDGRDLKIHPEQLKIELRIPEVKDTRLATFNNGAQSKYGAG